MVVVAAAIRLVAILHWDSLLFDEIVSMSIAKQPLAHMWHYLRWEMHTPAHFYYLHFWIQLFGDSEASARISSLVPGLASIVAVYFLAKELFQSKITGLYASFLVAFASFQSFYGIWTRMYALLFLASTLSFYFFIVALKTNKRRYWFLYGITTLLALFTHLTAFAIPAIQLVYLLYQRYRHGLLHVGALKTFIWLLAVQILALAPWVYNFVTIRLHTFSTRAWYFWAQGYDVFFINVPLQFVMTGNTIPYMELGALIIFGILFVRAFVSFKKLDSGSWAIINHTSSGQLLALMIFLVPLGFMFAIQLNALRLYMLPSLGVYLLFAYGLSQIGSSAEAHIKKLKGLTLQGWLLVLMGAIMFVPLVEVMRLPEVGWYTVMDFIESREQPNDAIVSGYYPDTLVFDYYYHGALPVNAMLPEQYKGNDILTTSLQTNFFPSFNQDTIDQFADLTQGHDRIFFVFSKRLFGNVYEDMITWFISDGWQLDEELVIPGFSGLNVWVLEKHAN